MKALNIQLSQELKKINYPLKSIFIGGGTPSSIEASLYDDIFISLQNFIDKNTEITIEANPNSTSKEWLKHLKNLGVNRISFGVQSFDDEKLKFLGRNHNKQMALQSITFANEVGFKNINLDIIYDTAIDTKELLESDLEIIKSLPINHISAYSLTIEEGTKFFKRPETRIENIDMAHFIFNRLAEFGFIQYEISNFSKSVEARSKHNFGYWEKEDYLGVGAGAVGCIKNERYYPKKDVQAYINEPTIYEEIETLDIEDINFERIFLGLRSLAGVPLTLFNKQQKEKIHLLVEDGKVTIKNEFLFNNDFLLSDEIALFLE
jgi:oxygen-independent coproporphyrinogen-3 oxidase